MSRLGDALKQHRADLRALIDTAKTSARCVDCKADLPPAVLLLRHRDPATALFAIEEWWELTPSVEVLEAELAKCDAVCRNCMALRKGRKQRSVETPRTGRRIAVI